MRQLSKSGVFFFFVLASEPRYLCNNNKAESSFSSVLLLFDLSRFRNNPPTASSQSSLVDMYGKCGELGTARVREVIAHLACRLSRWDYRLFRKSIFGAADEIELKFMNRRNHEDVNLFSIILNQEIRKLSRQVIRVKWSLHAREEIIFKLVQHLRENVARQLLEGLRKNTREMLEEQEAVCGRLFTIQDVMQSSVRAWLQVFRENTKLLDNGRAA
ncbi:Uncharacterized protein Rs2_06007 [Raphanus sativus]|nr:Uncharacterized protein Rs2_06007 [Raphanus sativus]